MGHEETGSGLISLLEKAANASTEGITVGTTDGDMPLIYVNDGFERLTGYSKEETVGKNCRFLQGADTDQQAVQQITEAILRGVECTVELLNYRKDGTPFWNRLSITPLKNDAGEVTHYVGVQSDVTELKETRQRLEEANRVLNIFNRKINEELDQAGKAQQFILPAEFPESDRVRFHAMYKPMDRIGGDFYDVIQLQKGVYGMMVADVTGHGIPAALLTFMISFAFKNSVHKISSPARVVSITNQKLKDKMPAGAFITMFYAIYDSRNHQLTYTRAGHPPGYILRPEEKKAIPLTTGGALVGAFGKKDVSFSEERIGVQPGDKILLYTDAIIESRDSQNEMMGMDHFARFLGDRSASSMPELFDEIYRFGLEFSGRHDYDDDFTLLGFEVLS
jgi:PAS domain S-box-containing protein